MLTQPDNPSLLAHTYEDGVKTTLKLCGCLECREQRLCLETDCSQGEYSTIPLCRECIFEFFTDPAKRYYGKGSYDMRMIAAVLKTHCELCHQDRPCLMTDCSGTECGILPLCKQCILTLFKEKSNVCPLSFSLSSFYSYILKLPRHS